MGVFFGKCFHLGEFSEIEELLVRKYSNIDYIYSKSIDDFVDFVTLAIEKEEEEKLYKFYLAKAVFADKDFPTFEEVLKDAKKQAGESESFKLDEWKQAEEIALQVVASFKGKVV